MLCTSPSSKIRVTAWRADSNNLIVLVSFSGRRLVSIAARGLHDLESSIRWRRPANSRAVVRATAGQTHFDLAAASSAAARHGITTLPRAVDSVDCGESWWTTQLSCGQAPARAPRLLRGTVARGRIGSRRRQRRRASDEKLADAERTRTVKTERRCKSADSKSDAVMAGANRRGRAQIDSRADRGPEVQTPGPRRVLALTVQDRFTASRARFRAVHAGPEDTRGRQALEWVQLGSVHCGRQ